MSLNYSASTSSIGTNNVFHDRGTLHVTKDDYKADFNEYAQASSSSSSSLFPPDGNREKRDLNKVIEQDLTTQVMDSMDMMFGVLSNGKEDVDRVKITLSKKANNQLDMKVKTSQGEPPINFNLERPVDDENTWLRHTIATLNQQMRDLQTEVVQLRNHIKHQVIAGYTIPGQGRWMESPDNRLLSIHPSLELVVDLSNYNLLSPPTTVMAQVYETRRGRVMGTRHACAVSEITRIGFRVKVNHFRGGLRRAQKRRWHVYFMCAY